MQLSLFVPGLLWPNPQTPDPVGAQSLPALAALLGRGRRTLGPARPAEHALLDLFGLAADTALAAIRRRGEDRASADESAHWLCADPVGLSFAREHLLLADASTLDVAAAEAERLIVDLNRDFSELGRFEAGTPERWYLCTHAPVATRFAPLAAVVARPLAHHLPEGPDAAQWHRLINELQIWLHNHAVNREREAAGRPLLNSLWFWGGGAAPAGPGRPAAVIHADAPLPLGLARLAGMREGHARSYGELAAADDALVCVDALERAALALDLDGWRAALAALDTHWLAPALAALRAGSLTGLTLHAPGERATLQVAIDRRARWQFWKRPLPLRRLDTLHP